MPEYLSPGVYIQEINSGPRPIEGVGTACAAFVGFAPSGPINKPQLITNWTQYSDMFGIIGTEGRRDPHMEGAYLSHAVHAYFLNGGGRCYVTRIVAGNSKADPFRPVPIPSRSKSSPTRLLTFSGKSVHTCDIVVEIKEDKGKEDKSEPKVGRTPAPSSPPAEGAPAPSVEPPLGPDSTFTVIVRIGNVPRETYANLTIGKGPRNVVEVINQNSELVKVEVDSKINLSNYFPASDKYSIDRMPLPDLPEGLQQSELVGDVSERSGIEGLAIADDVTMVCFPDLMAAFLAKKISLEMVEAAQRAMIDHCERMGDRMAILDPLPNLSPQQVKQWRGVANYDSKFAALYYPWLKIMGPDGKEMLVPPSGHVAGVWARSDNERGVHKAPANETIRGISEVAHPITQGEQDTLNPNGINCIRAFTGRGIRIWGARTLSSDPAWRYINVRRLFNFVEKSIEQGTQWVVFEPNDHNLWARVRRDVGAFLVQSWRDGMLFGRTPDEAFFVKCDDELNPSESRDQGKLIIEVGMAPVKPAEFVIFRFSQWVGGGA